MRKFQKEQISKHVRLLQEACDVLAAQSSGSKRINLCADMQEYVLAILNFLGSLDEENTELMERLSELYKVLLEVSQEEVSVGQLTVQLKEAASYIEDKVAIDKMEVAFFCHRASMGQCLKNIYQDIQKYDGWDVYFIPIPYFDKDQTGALGEMHYEAAGEYPDKLELVDWKAYHVEKRHPDIVFITDAYDEYDCLTTVHPDFYASRIREVTDLLVCVPYMDQECVAASDIRKLPGICLADKVVVPSEDVKERYIDNILTWGQDITRDVLKKKIITYDSLKIGMTLEM